jgi:glycosyltransferase involved in cell wall biosynthesis
MTLVSIICPTYNEELYIVKCIESMVSQNIDKEGFEVLFVDGGSTDLTVNLIQKFQQKYNFIKLLNNPDKVVPYAMNIGIDKAVGDILIRIDAHSYYPENYVSVLVSNLIKMNADNVGAICITDVLTKNKKTTAIKEVLSNSFGVGNSLFRLGVSEITEVDTVPFGCYRKEVFTKYGLYNTKLVRNQDIELNKRIKRGGGKIYLIPDTYCVYYAREKYREIIKNNYLNGKWSILTVYITKTFNSLSVRHFVPMLFLLSILFPLLVALVYFPFLYLAIFSIALYLGLIIIVCSMISINKKINFGYLLVTFILLHFSYGFGSLIGIASIPFQKNKITKHA